jgi:hypothetical protein
MVFFGRGQVAREGGGDSCGSAEQGHAALNPDSGSNEFLGKRAQRGSIFPPPHRSQANNRSLQRGPGAFQM